jgi:catechol 2,3-dioxygenase-like lactoylglutathione lyase family enzyme
LTDARVPSIDHVVIAVTNWQVSNTFYRDVLGAEVVSRPGGYVYRIGSQYLSVHHPPDDVRLLARGRVQPGNSDLCFVWDGPIESAVAHLEAHGVEITAGPLESPDSLGRPRRHVYFRDPDGSLLEFVSFSHEPR